MTGATPTGLPADPHPATLTAEILPLGVDGVLLRFATRFDPAANAAAIRLAAALDAADIPGKLEVAPALASVLLRFDPASAGRAEVAAAAAAVQQSLSHGAAEAPARRWTVPVAFGPDNAPQLAEAADKAGLTLDQAVKEITGTPVRVLTIGFAPGQPYLGLLPEHWNIPRQSQVTPEVPAGALIVAVRQLIVFQAASPTGWRWIGRAAFRPFQADRAEPFALRAGDELRFAAVSDDALDRLRADNPDGLGGATCAALT
jgi:KipI family sensor histidine kinase inhibitor